jgi:hypothetical protein
MATAPKHLYHLRVMTLKKFAGSARFQGCRSYRRALPGNQARLEACEPNALQLDYQLIAQGELRERQRSMMGLTV